MSVFARLARTRLAAEIRFVLGGALAGAAAGTGVGLLRSGEVFFFSHLDPLFPPFVVIAQSVAVGWWGGLLWSVALAVLARRMDPRPPAATLAPAAWVAAAAVVLVALAARLGGAPLPYGAIAGALLGTLLARRILARATTASQQ